MQGDFLKMGDADLEHLAGDADLLMFMADDFYAQARGNRLALKLLEVVTALLLRT